MLPLVGCGLLAVLFFRFILGGLFGNRANLARLTFAGTLLVANLALVLIIFGAFFIEVKLIPTLWLLLFISPISLLIGQRALSQADCSIGEWKGAAPKPKKD